MVVGAASTLSWAVARCLALRAGVNYPDLLVRVDEIAGDPVRTARPGRVKLEAAERALSLAVRWWERAYVAVHRLGERRASAVKA